MSEDSEVNLGGPLKAERVGGERKEKDNKSLLELLATLLVKKRQQYLEVQQRKLNEDIQSAKEVEGGVDWKGLIKKNDELLEEFKRIYRISEFATKGRFQETQARDINRLAQEADDTEKELGKLEVLQGAVWLLHSGAPLTDNIKKVIASRKTELALEGEGELLDDEWLDRKERVHKLIEDDLGEGEEGSRVVEEEKRRKKFGEESGVELEMGKLATAARFKGNLGEAIFKGEVFVNELEAKDRQLGEELRQRLTRTAAARGLGEREFLEKLDLENKDWTGEEGKSIINRVFRDDVANEALDIQYKHYVDLANSIRRVKLKNGRLDRNEEGLYREFKRVVVQAAESRAREIKNKKVLNWVRGGYNPKEFREMLKAVFTDPSDIESAVMAAERLAKKKPGEAVINSGEIKDLNTLVSLLTKKVKPLSGQEDYFKDKLPGERDRLVEYLGNLRTVVKRALIAKRVPSQFKTAEDFAREGKRRDATLELPPDVPVPMEAFAAPEGPFGGGGGRGMYGIPEEMIKKHLVVRTDLGETPQEAVERGLNTFLETGANARTLYYFNSMLQNLISGEKGHIPEPLLVLYHAAQGHNENYGFITSITSPEQLLQVGARMTAGTDDDLVERKYFDDYGGLQEVKIDGKVIKARGLENSEELEFFSIGPLEVMDMFSDDYWFSYFQDKGRALDQNPKRQEVMNEVMWVNLGGRVEMREVEGKLERRYFMDGVMDGLSEEEQLNGLDIKSLKNVKLRFGKQMKIARVDSKKLEFDYEYKDEVTLDELAKAHMWMIFLGEAHWELTGRRAVMNKSLKGRRTIYQWDKYVNNYDAYLGGLEAHGGFPAYNPAEQQAIMNLSRADYVSRLKEKMGAFLWSVDDFKRVDQATGLVVPGSLVPGVKSRLADGDEDLAREFVEMMNRKFVDPQNVAKDKDLFRMAFVTEEEMAERLGKGKKEGIAGFIKGLEKRAKRDDEGGKLARGKLQYWKRWQTARLDDADKKLISRMSWDKLFHWLAGDVEKKGVKRDDLKYVPPRMIPEERDYVLEKIMGGKWNQKAQKWTFKGKDKPEPKEYEAAAKWFFEHFSDRFYKWGVMQHNQHMKEANYTYKASQIASKMVEFNAGPTADKLLEWVLPLYNINPGNQARKIAFNAASWNLKLLTRFRIGPSVLAEAKERGLGKFDWDGLDEYGYPKKKRRSFWKRPGESLMIWWSGAGRLKGHKALDAWAKKQYIYKILHNGAKIWVQSEALKAEFLTPAPFGGSFGGRFLAWFINIEEKVPWLSRQSGWIRNPVILLSRYPALAVAKAIQFSYLDAWIHDWEKAGQSFWNEVVAPGLAGENAKALQIQSK